MARRNNLFKWRYIISFMMVLLLPLLVTPDVLANSSIKLMVDGEDIIATPEPFIQNDRTLVPIRIISEELGAQVNWDNDDRTVEIIKDDMSVLLRIDSYLIEYNTNNEKIYNLSDVPAQIIDERTFVPLRVVSNALGVGIEWDDLSRMVYIDSTKSSNIENFFDIQISSVNSGQVINGTINLKSVMSNIEKASEIKYILLNRDTAKGFVIARGTDLEASFKWNPSIEDNGQKILVAAIYGSNGTLLAGDAIPVEVNIIPKVYLNGMYENQIIKNSTEISANLNFTPAYVKYEMIHSSTGDVYISPKWDPEGSFTMIPVMEDNGYLAIKVIAYDINDNSYPSDAVTVNVNVSPQVSLRGVSNWQSIDGPITLRASTNFNVSETEYIMRDTITGSEITLSKEGFGSYTLFPGPDMAGKKELYVKVKDTMGQTYTSAPVYVNVSGTPKLLLKGIGPNQVVTGDFELNVLSNVTLDSLKYTMVNTVTGVERDIDNGYTPSQGDTGTWKIKAEGIYNSNKKIESEYVQFTIYQNKIYGPLPIIEKNKFIDMASELAKDTYEDTGMSAALQTAQAILETGWGQSVPVDKYSGQFSYNLFGIKGSGSAGSVISNTWEEYNGVAYRVDDYFRAYNNINESWDDHNKLLLTADRYSIYRDVMYDSSKGAWALRRAGYATDSQYPIKLIDIINRYNLKTLDEIGI